MKQQLEKKVDEFKQKFCRTEQALQATQTKEEELRRSSEVSSGVEELSATFQDEVGGRKDLNTVFSSLSRSYVVFSLTCRQNYEVFSCNLWHGTWSFLFSLSILI